MPGVEVRIVHPESHARVDDGTQGLILIKGPNVFPGYVGTSLDPFVTVDGDRWYNSGDLGYLHNGSLVITGRLKRFIKIGGEMISLGAVEEAFAPLVPSPDGAPTVAILARGAEGTARPELVLFCGNGGIDTDQANEHLKANGFPHIVRIAEVKKLKAIPVLGTGKTDYQSLKAQLS